MSTETHEQLVAKVAEMALKEDGGDARNSALKLLQFGRVHIEAAQLVANKVLDEATDAKVLRDMEIVDFTATTMLHGFDTVHSAVHAAAGKEAPNGPN